MGGSFSRSKGARGERGLVHELTKIGYKAERILRQYQQAGQPDVIAYKDDPTKTITFEVKCRKEMFKRIYDMYYSERGDDNFMAFVVARSLVLVTTSLPDMLKENRDNPFFRSTDITPLPPKFTRVLERLFKMKELKQSADYLVIKDNNKPWLYIKYWD